MTEELSYLNISNESLYEVIQQLTIKQAINYGIIDLKNMIENNMVSKRNKINTIHPYAITPPATSTGRWQTSYKDKLGNRKNVKAQTEDALFNKLISIYNDLWDNGTIIFHNLFTEWIEYKKNITDNPNTIKRHIQRYNKYLKTSALHNKNICNINEMLLEEECNRIVKSFNLTRKEWNNVKTILNGMFSYALRKEYLTKNVMEQVRIFVRFRQVVRKTGRTETYNTEELNQLNNYLDEMYNETNDVVFLAVKLNFLLGLRIGELVALRFEDICDNNLHIVREEVRDQTTNTYHIVPHTKTNCDRFVVLVPKAKEILSKIKPTDSYVFMRYGERITSRQIAYVLEKFAERNGIITKSSHKIRKTYASRLNANGVPLDCIREQLGHSSLSTTFSYIFNPLTEQETYNLIEKAL